MAQESDLRARYGTWAMVAGASEGVGLALAEALGEAGFNLVMIARRSELLEPAARDIGARHVVETIPLSLDLSAPRAAATMEQIALERDVGLFVFNAGGETSGARFVEGSLDQWSALVSRNVGCLMESMYRFGRRFSERGRGAIVNVCSGAALGGCDHLAVYSATKAFALNLCEAMWYELKPKGVDVLSVLLDGTDTPTTRATLAARGIDPDGMPLARPEAIAQAALAHLDAGPSWFYGEPDTAGPRAVARRDHTEQVSAMMEMFYGAG